VRIQVSIHTTVFNARFEEGKQHVNYNRLEQKSTKTRSANSLAAFHAKLSNKQLKSTTTTTTMSNQLLPPPPPGPHPLPFGGKYDCIDPDPSWTQEERQLWLARQLVLGGQQVREHTPCSLAHGTDVLS
jgi:hypothetical protein